jgi:hypothetical protein
VDVTIEALAAFGNRVQPVLMNTCLRCHSGDRGGHFRLTRAYDGGPLNRRATQQNLAAVLAQVDLDHFELSPLLIKAVSVHGTCEHPPIQGVGAPPYNHLRQWLEMVRATNPHLREVLKRSKPNSEAPAAPRAAAPTWPAQAQAGPQVVSSPVPFDVRSATAPGGPEATGAPAPAEGPVDEFDPALFNRQRPGGPSP